MHITEANMTMCRTHDINCTDIHNIFPDFSADVNDESSYHFEESDKQRWHCLSYQTL